MEKLILRSVMYGADKIPDSWFEKVPGGFYKEKDNPKSQNGKSGQNRNSGSGSSGKRRNTNNYDNRRRYEDDDQGYRSEGGARRDRRSRSSYDRPADDDYYDDRRGPRREKSHRRRRSFDDDRNWRDDDGYGRHPHPDGHYGGRESGRRPPYPQVDPYYDRGRPSTGGSDQPANPFSRGAGVAAGAAAEAPPYPQSSDPRSPSLPSPSYGSPAPQQARNGGIGNGYVPYADIYGQPTPRQPFSPPPPSDGSVRPNSLNQVSPPIASPQQGYQQNPFAQQAPTAAAAGAGAEYDGRAGFMNQDPRKMNGYDPRYSARRFNGYDENEQTYSESPPPPRRPSRQDYSPSYDSYDSPADNPRRSRSERRNDDRRERKPQNQGRSKSRVREAFDPSQRGLSYGAVGAVAGGLAGREIGKGAIPMAIGATIGALGANAFEARDRYVDSRQPLSAQSPTTQPRPPPANDR